MSFAICSALLPAYQAWKSSLDEMRRAMVAYQAFGEDADRIAFDAAVKNGEGAREKYQQEAYEKTVERTYWNSLFVEKQTFEICFRDALLMERIQTCFVSSFAAFSVSVANCRIISLEHFSLQEDQASNGDAFIRYGAMLSSLITLSVPPTTTVIPEQLPPGLEILKLSRSRITALPKHFPPRLRELYVDGTAITCVPNNLPLTVTKLLCGDNARITALPDPLPPNLTILSFSGTKVSQLPSLLPRNLRKLICEDTLIDDLPELRDSLQAITITNTPAARDRAIRARLGAFRKKYPNAQVDY